MGLDYDAATRCLSVGPTARPHAGRVPREGFYLPSCRVDRCMAHLPQADVSQGSSEAVPASVFAARADPDRRGGLGAGCQAGGKAAEGLLK